MQLALGTVQFGMAYGIAGAPQVPAAEVRAILACAARLGVRMLDTAPGYGDIEERLAALADAHGFEVVSKIPALPAGLAAGELRAWIRDSLARSLRRLGPCLRALLFHRAEDLLHPVHGPLLWQEATDFTERHGLRLGASVYDPRTLQDLARDYPLTLAQAPGNAWDQRLHEVPPPAGVPVHVRSAFLQGLLLQPVGEAERRLPACSAAMAHWQGWCQARGLSAPMAALGIVKGLPGASHCLVGVDSLGQFEAIAEAWSQAPVLHARELEQSDPDLIDPRRWPPRP